MLDQMSLYVKCNIPLFHDGSQCTVYVCFFQPMFQSMIPKIMVIISALIAQDEVNACVLSLLVIQ